MKRHERAAEKHFQAALKKYIAAGAHAKRGLSEDKYVEACRSLWNRAKTDAVYAVKIFVEPLVDTQFASESSEIFCVLVARRDPDGRLIDAPAGYGRAEEPGIRLSNVVIGSPLGAPSKASGRGIATYLLAYFDILGFKRTLEINSLKAVHELYEKTIESAVKPQNAQFSKNVAISSTGNVMPALMWAPFEVAYSSDSILLFVQFHPQYVEEFLWRSALLFCSALRCGVPLRGALAVGEAVFNVRKNVFLGAPLVEASSLEKELDCIGVAIAKSMQRVTMMPPHLVHIISPAMTEAGTNLFGGLVLDWPRVWRNTFSDSAVTYLNKLRPADGSAKVLARYDTARDFYDYSERNQHWCIPEGSAMISPEDVWKQAGQGD